MDVLARILSGGLHASGTPGPADDWWYGPAAGPITAAGTRIDSESAQKVSAWFRGRDLLATTLAMLPFGMYERLPGGAGRDDAEDHPLHDVIHSKPNPWQDSFLWRRQGMYKLIDYGNHYSHIRSGARGFAHELWPIEPSCVKPELLASGRKVFHIRDPKSGMTRTFTQDEIFHVCGPSDDGVEGKGILGRARDSLGLSLALEGYAATIFSRGAMHGGVIKIPGILNDEASKRMARSIKDSTSGPANWHMPYVLEQGAEWSQNSMTPEDAQMLLSRKFSVNDIARWLGIPPHMLGDLDKSSFSNIEQQGQEFVTYALGPWLSMWEFAANDQLVLNRKKFYAEFNRDALVRGDLAARWEAYQTAVSTGVFTRNEIRVIENKKKLPGLDEPLDPAFLTGSKGQQPTGGAPKPKPSQSGASQRAEAIVQKSAAVLLKKEINHISRMAVKHSAHGDEFAAAVTEFYSKHAALVSEWLQLPADVAAEYCASQAAQVVAGDWLAAVELWKEDAYAAGLAGLALEAA